MKKNTSTIKENILKYTKYKGYSKRKIYISSGISNGVLDKPTGLTEDNIHRFLSAFTEVNPSWLITGEGEMLKDNSNEPVAPQLAPDKIKEIVDFVFLHRASFIEQPLFKELIATEIARQVLEERESKLNQLTTDLKRELLDQIQKISMD